MGSVTNYGAVLQGLLSVSLYPKGRKRKRGKSGVVRARGLLLSPRATQQNERKTGQDPLASTTEQGTKKEAFTIQLKEKRKTEASVPDITKCKALSSD